MRTKTAKQGVISTIVVSRGRPLVILLALAALASGPSGAFAQCVPPDCNDGLFCTVDICSAGLCFNNTRNCQDGSFCNGAEVCDDTRDLCAVACLGGGTCTSGVCVGGSNPGAACDAGVVPINCPPGLMCSDSLLACVECTTNSECGDPQKPFCDPSSGFCVTCFSDAQCSNGLLCDGTETCNLTTNVCQDGSPVQCDIFGDPPTFCSELFAGTCVECETAGDCAGGTFCNPKSCSAGTCTNATPTACKRCKDINNNQSGPCDDDGDCSAGFTCTGASSFCSDVAGRCVMCLADANCEDLNFCTRNECSKLDYTCQYPPDGATLCAELNGFLFCDGPELCVNQIGTCDPFTGAGCCLPGTPPVIDDGIPCTVDSCDEQNDVVVHAPDNSFCDDSFFCTGDETCDPGHGMADASGCVAGVDVDCSFLDAECRVGKCDEVTDACTTDVNPLFEGTSCDDGDPCTAASICGNQTCNEVPPLPNDPYRCIEFEWRNGPVAPIDAQTEFTLDLYAKANGCALTPAGVFPSDDACVAAGGHPIVGVKAVLEWDRAFVELAPLGLGSPNPEHICFNSSDPCFSCPAGTYNWAQSGFFNDCAIDGLNDPCNPAQVPNNDGNALHESLSYAPNFPCCDGCTTTVGSAACILPEGLFIASFRFTARSGGSTSVAIAGCGGDRTESKVSTRIAPPTGYINGNVLNGTGPAWPVDIICNGPADCDDLNACTSDVCNAGTCVFTDISASCDDGNLCTDDSCDPALGCQAVIDDTNDCNDGDACNGSETCVAGICTNGSPPVCDDGNLCTDDSCVAALGCQFTNNTAPCDDGEFCTASPDVCAGGICIGGGDACPGQFCDEVDNVCFDGCADASECNDNDPCTDDVCDAQSVCRNPSICPTHPDPCIINTCNAATVQCEAIPVLCGAGEECFEGDCFTACQTVVDCDDGIACTTDTCDTVNPVGGPLVDICFHATDDSLCDTGLFCSQQRCDVDLGCVLAYECISTTGNPCPDQGTCDDVADNCGGCLAPAVAGVGSRYLSVTPQDQGATPLALLVEGACGDPDIGCVSTYVQSICVGGSNAGQICQSDADCPKLCELGANAGDACMFNVDCAVGGGTCVGFCSGFTLGPAPSFHPASFWGETRVGGVDIRPASAYQVRTVCNFGGGQVASASAIGATYAWGDANGDGFINVTDIVGVVDVVKAVLILPIAFEGANMWPCDLDTTANVTDITVTVDAVKGVGYPCGSVCP
jgi:Dictyostelium (slime mold) repeat